MKKDEGYYYLEDLGISVQGIETNKAVLEIMHQCRCNDIAIIITIKLCDNSVIQIDY